MPLSRRLLRPAAALVAAASLPVLSACGGSSGDPGADPAAIVPARTAFYVEANLKPSDDVKELAKKLSGEDDPGAALKRAIEKQAQKDDPDFKFSEDIDPWLGDKAALFAPEISPGRDSPVGVVLPTKDADKAKEALENDLRKGDKDGPKPQVVKRTHRDTEYIVDTAKDDAVAIVGDYAVVGSDAAIKAAIDADKDESLADSSEYDKARGAVENDGVGFAYVRLSQIFSGLGPQGAAARQVFKGLGETLSVGLDGDASTITLDSAALGLSGSGSSGGPGKVLADLPASAWFAFGASDVGGAIKKAIDQFTQLGALGGQDPEKLLDRLEARFGIDPRRDLADWLGDIGVFTFGDTPSEFGAGLVATTKDAAATRRAIPRIARFLHRVAGVSVRPLHKEGIDTGVTLKSPRLRLPIHLALSDDDRFIVGLTNGGLAQALRKTDPLGESKPFTQAAGELGDGIEPSLFLNFAPLPGFLDATGAGSDPNVAKIVTALKRLTTMAAGFKREGDTSHGRVVIGVK